MRLTRHAKNRLRWMRRSEPTRTEADLLIALGEGVVIGRDVRSNAHVWVRVGGMRLVVVVDEMEQMVITMWREG